MTSGGKKVESGKRLAMVVVEEEGKDTNGRRDRGENPGRSILLSIMLRGEMKS